MLPGFCRANLTSIEHQTSPALIRWITVAPGAITGYPRVRVKFSIAPGETRKFLRLLLTQ